MSVNTQDFLTELAEYITRTRALVAEGKEVELADMHALAERLCAQAEQAQGEARARHAEEFTRLVGELNALAVELSQRRASVLGEMQGLTDFRKASVAYRTTDASDNYRPQEE